MIPQMRSESVVTGRQSAVGSRLVVEVLRKAYGPVRSPERNARFVGVETMSERTSFVVLQVNAGDGWRVI
jgi:hypothetical protein